MSEQDPSVTRLPEKPEITRRDFVGGTLVGTGAALLAMASPGAVCTAHDTGEDLDVVVVGCGIAGLSAGWTYRKARPNGTVLMLDQHPIFGGEAKQNEFEVDGYHLTAPVPFGGYKQSGFGRDKSLHALDKYLQLKTTWIKL